MQGSYKVNFDASIRQDRRQAGLGVVIRDWQGVVIIAWRRKTIAHIQNPEVAESYAALLAVLLARQL